MCIPLITLHFAAPTLQKRELHTPLPHPYLMCIEGHSSPLITGQTGIRKPRPFATTKETIMRIFALAILAATAFASAPSFAQTIATSSPIPANTYVNGGYNALQSGRINTGTV
jgi:hypothetical protein